MADKRKPPESPDSGPRRKRAAPTIDLKATELPPDPAAAAAAMPDPQSEPAPPPEQVPAPEMAASEPASAEPASSEAAPGPESEPKAEPESEPEPERAAPPPPPPPRGGLGAGVAGGVIGAVIVAAIGGGLWAAGYIPAASTQNGDLPGRVATLEKQVQTLQNKPAPKADTAALDKHVAALSQRVSKLESELGNMPPADKTAVQNIGKLADTLKSLRDEVNALGKRTDTIAGAAKQADQNAAAAQKAVGDLKQSVQHVASAQNQTPAVPSSAFDALQKKVAALDDLQTKVDGLDKALASTRSQLNDEIKSVRGTVTGAQQQIAKATSSERATRRALSTTALRNAVLSGAPYAAQLAQAKALGADGKALAPLSRFAQSGLPTKNEFAKELIKLIPAMRNAAGETKSSGDFLTRLRANAEKLVRVTPVQAPAGNQPADILARLEVEAAHADIAGALADLDKLPDNVRAPAHEWIAKAKARQAALNAAHDVAAHAARELGNR